MKTIIIHDLQSARLQLKQIQEPVIITNLPKSTKYYGVLVIDYIFKTLNIEFTNITQSILQYDGDLAALHSADKLGYVSKDINPKATYLLKH